MAHAISIISYLTEMQWLTFRTTL